eukprot:tig00000571_g2203.t1
MDDTTKELTALLLKLKKAGDEETGDPTRAVDLLQEVWSMDKYITVETLRACDLLAVLKKLRNHSNSSLSEIANRIYNALKTRFTGKSPTNAPSAGKPASSPKDSPPPAAPSPTAKQAGDKAAGAAAAAAGGASSAAKAAAPTASTVAKAAPAAGGSDGGNIPQTGDKSRDKCRKDMADALALVGTPDRADQIRVAVAIESAMFAEYKGVNKQYTTKYRSLLFNLKDDKNPELRKKVLYGAIEPAKLIKMEPKELASDQMQKTLDEIAKKKLEEVKPDWEANKATTDQFKCGKCGKRETTYYQMQTRSADEPMTTFISCVNCGNKWKM